MNQVVPMNHHFAGKDSDGLVTNRHAASQSQQLDNSWTRWDPRWRLSGMNARASRAP